MENLNKIFFILLFLSSCSLTQYTYDPIYEDNTHTTEVYWYTDYEVGGTPYFGYWDNFYYYYGVPHFYPWWYYYQFIPPYHYYTNTHITIMVFLIFILGGIIINLFLHTIFIHTLMYTFNVTMDITYMGIEDLHLIIM